MLLPNTRTCRVR